MNTMWRIQIQSPVINANHRLHWHEKGRRTAAIRDEVMGKAILQKIPNLDSHCHVQLVLVPLVNRRRDSENFEPTMKPALDGLVKAKVITDDTPHMVKTDRAFIAPTTSPHPKGLYLIVTRLDRPVNDTNPLDAFTPAGDA